MVDMSHPRVLGIVMRVAALERNGYVERSFFRTRDDGVAMVTRLERMNSDGSPSRENERWPAGFDDSEEAGDILHFLSGLFFVEAGHYRVIVFVLQALPFGQSTASVTGPEALAWVRAGANLLPSDVAVAPFKGGHCSALIYEFASDGTRVHVIPSRLTGKQHLEKSGVLAFLAKRG
jgi:hypothetical protein